MNVSECERCGSKIMENQSFHPNKTVTVGKVDEDNHVELKDVRICSMCWDDLWDWAHGEDAPDRSHLADPEPLDRMKESVERHIDYLNEAVSELEAQEPE